MMKARHDTLSELTKTVIAFRDERNWKQFHKPKDVVISLLLEAAEVAEHFQWKSDDEIRRYVRSTAKNDIGDELADVLYWVLLLAHDLKIDLPASFEAKMRKNAEKYPVEKARNRHTKYTKL